jgi:hypothetical protein
MSSMRKIEGTLFVVTNRDKADKHPCWPPAPFPGSFKRTALLGEQRAWPRMEERCLSIRLLVLGPSSIASQRTLRRLFKRLSDLQRVNLGV